MFDYLIDHALKNVWCTPDQDLQTIVKPARITGASGVFNHVDVLWRSHTLPIKNTRFHVYQIGQLHPSLMGLFNQDGTWLKMADVCNLQSMIINIYANSGVQMPLSETWYMVTRDKNLIIAVKDQPRIPIKLPEEDLYFRVYSNAYFHSLRSDVAADGVEVRGGTMADTAAIMALQNRWQATWNRNGYTLPYVNGFKVDAINLLTVKPGDVAEFVYDSSIYQMRGESLIDLKTFTSLLDSKQKYLLHTPVVFGDGTIDYHDDLDFFIAHTDAQGNRKAVYYHRNQPDAVRMVTHQDYSVVVAYVLAYASDQAGWTNIDTLGIEFYMRKSGYVRPLVNENNRIKELYKLSDEDIVRAMLGVDSVVPAWRAEQLEASAYAEIMRSNAGEITPAMVQAAYGYNAISKLVADTPEFTLPYSGQKIVALPYGLQHRGVGYEYDSEGLLLGWFSHPTGRVYTARDIRTRLVEMVAGNYDDKPDEAYGEMEVELDPTANYRMYLCPIVGGLPTNVWRDVTGGGEYGIIGNTLTWVVDLTKWYPMVRSDKVILAYNIELMMTDGLLKFSLNQRALRNGQDTKYVMQIPMGELDLFLNGRSLVEGIDYIVQFPEIVILNKEYLIDPAGRTQKIAVRFSGFCNPDLSRDIPDDSGFVQYGLLSKNNRFDIRDDKVMRIVVDGKLYDRSELKFAEMDSGISVNERNGSPYLIKDIITPLRGLTQDTTYSLRAKSQVIDQQVSDYMTLKIPQPVITAPNVIPALYQLVSPMLCKILYDLKNQVLEDPRLKAHYNDALVLELCKPYEYLLAYDPTQEALGFDERYIVIHPHPLPVVMELDIYYYKFITRVNYLYLRNKVELSHLIRLAP